MKVSISNYLLRRLNELDVHHLFGIPGDYMLPFFNELLDGDHGVKQVNMPNELTGGYAADGYAKINGFGAVAGTFGPGALNATNAVAGAYADDIPLILITGTPKTEVLTTPTEKMYHHAVQTHLDANLDVFRAITISAQRIMRVEDAATIIDDILCAAIQNKKPCYLEIPFDLQTAEIDAPDSPLATLLGGSSPQLLQAAVEQAVKTIENANSRAVVVGHLIEREKQTDVVCSLIEKIGATVVTTFQNKNGAFESSPNAAGFYMGRLSLENTRNVVERAEIVILVGKTDNELDSGLFSSKPDEESQIAILLDHVIVNGHRFDHVYLKDFLPALLNALEMIEPTSLTFPEGKKKFFYDRSEPFTPTNEKLTVDRTMLRLAHYFREGDIMFGETGGYLSALQIGFPDKSLVFGNGNWLSLGSGFGNLVGATFTKESNRRIIGILGDGGFHMTVQGLSTLFMYEKNVALFVLNNAGYTIERAIHPESERTYNNIFNWKYHLLPEAFGGVPAVTGNGYEVRTEKELDEILSILQNPKGVNIVNIHLDPYDLGFTHSAIGEKFRH